MTGTPNLIDRANQTLDRVTTAALATMSADGSPWNSPVCVAFDGTNVVHSEQGYVHDERCEIPVSAIRIGT
jgi:hypothetical protein